MQGLPPLSAQFSDGPVGRRGRQRHQEHPGSHARHDVAAFPEVVRHRSEVKAGIEPYLGEQMQAAIEERKEAKQAAKAYQPGEP